MDSFDDVNVVNTNEETDKKCPQCGGVMKFDPATGNLKCPYCEYEAEITQKEELPEKAEELDFFAAEHTANKDWGVKTKTVLCKACDPEYIAGFVAERYTIGLKDSWDIATDSIDKKLKQSISRKIRFENNADHVRGVSVSTSFQDITYKYLLLPIWVSNFKYKEKVYQFMINGQTGKVSGRIPLSIPKIILAVIGGILITALALYIFYVMQG